jgi:hypothetical protein
MEEQLKELLLLKELTRTFFDDYLNEYEVSDNDREFFPIHISCCRCLKLEPLNDILRQMQELSGAKPKPILNKHIIDEEE